MGQSAVEQQRLISARTQAKAEVGAVSLKHKIYWAPYYILVQLSRAAIATIRKATRVILEGGTVSLPRTDPHEVSVLEQKIVLLLGGVMDKIVEGERRRGKNLLLEEAYPAPAIGEEL